MDASTHTPSSLQSKPSSDTIDDPQDHDEASPAATQVINSTLNDVESTPVTPFTHTLGAWTKPLKFTPPPSTTCASSPCPSVGDPISPRQWPLLSGHRESKRKKRDKVPMMPNHDSFPLELKKNGSPRFPWAAKLDQSKRNLFRTTKPSYMEDGTPKVSIPRSLLLHGPENRKEYVIGQFYRCVLPSGGLTHAVVNRLWGRKGKIFSRKLGESSYLFHIPDEQTRSWVLQRGLWHVDGCLMFVAPWTSSPSLAIPEITTAPVWVTLRNIPDGLYSLWGFSQLGSGIGEPITTHKPRIDPTQLGVAKILVEVELDKPLPQRVAAEDPEGTISLVDVEYDWIPRHCGRCGLLGHKETRCLNESPKETNPIEVDHPIVGSAVDNVHSDHAIVENQTEDVSDVAMETTIKITHEEMVTTTTPSPKFVHPNLSIQKEVNQSSSNLEAIDNNTTTTTTEFKAIDNNTTTTTTTEFTNSPTDLTHQSSLNIDSHLISSDKAEFEPNRDGNHVYVGYASDPNGIQRTRGGRQVKPSQKVQDMEWTTIRRGGERQDQRGRGKHH